MFVPSKIKEGNPDCMLHVPCSASKSGVLAMAVEACDFEHPETSMLTVHNTTISASAMFSGNGFILYRRRRRLFLCVREELLTKKAPGKSAISSLASGTFIHLLYVRPGGKPADYFYSAFCTTSISMGMFEEMSSRPATHQGPVSRNSRPSWSCNVPFMEMPRGELQSVTTF